MNRRRMNDEWNISMNGRMNNEWNKYEWKND